MSSKRLLKSLISLSISLAMFSAYGISEANASTSNYDSKFKSMSLAKGYKDLNQGNPCMTQRFTADPGVMEYDGKVYVYTTNDQYMYKNGQVIENNYSNIQTINCMSSSDMVNWTDHGTINAAGSVGAAKWASCSWAPCAAHKTINGKEKFFLYFANNANGIGVLTSDSPTGPWTDPIGHPLVSRSTANCNGVTWLFDPAVLVDDDGNGYLYFGGGVPNGQNAHPKTARVVKLGGDMISLAGTPATIDAPYMFEDSGINKVGNTYYYTYCTNWSSRSSNSDPEIAVISYMTSNSPMGPFTYQGKIFDNPGKYFGCTGNNHHSIVKLNNKNYLFYHSQWLENKMGTNKGYRNTHVDELNISNGKISWVKGTLTGVSQVKNVDPYTVNRASNMAYQGGIQVIGLGNTQVEMNNADWFGISNVDFGSGASSVSVKAASKNGAVIKVCADTPSSAALGYISVSSTGSNSNFKNISTNISKITGTKKLFFVSSGDCYVDNWQFSKNASSNTSNNEENNQGSNQGSDSDVTAGTINDGWYYIKNVNAQKYLQVKDNVGKASQNVELSKGTGAKGQKWYLKNVGDGYITLQSALGNYMLDVLGGKNTDGTNVQIYNAYSNDAQKFLLKASSKQGAYVITTKCSNGSKALDDYNFGTTDGTNVCEWTYGGYANQQWIFEKTNN